MTAAPRTARPELDPAYYPTYQRDIAEYAATIRSSGGSIGWTPAQVAQGLLADLPGCRRERTIRQQVIFVAANAVLRGEL